MMFIVLTAATLITVGIVLCKNELDKLNAVLREDSRKYRARIAVQDSLMRGETPTYS